MNEFLRNFTETVSMLYGLPAAGITLIACLLWGMVLKSQKSFNNDRIPTILMWIGSLIFLGCQDWYGSKLPLNVFIVKGIVIGWVIGFFAPKIHAKYIKPWESRIPLLGDLLARGNSDPLLFVKGVNAEPETLSSEGRE